LEYRKVQANLEKTIATLQANREAKNVLCQKFIQKRWIDVRSETPTDNELMVLVLNRIELSADTYSEFIEMLGNIPDLEVIKKRIDTTTVAFQEQEPPKQGSAAMVASVGQPFSSVQASKGYTGGQGPLISGEGGHVKPESNTRDDSGLASTTIGYDSEPYYNHASSVGGCADNCEANLGQLSSQLSDDSVPQELSTSFDGVTQHQSSSDFPTGTEEQHCHGNDSPPMCNSPELEETMLSDEDPTDSECKLLGLVETFTQEAKKEVKELHIRLTGIIKEKNGMIKQLRREKKEADKRYQEQIKSLEKKTEDDKSNLETMKSVSADLEKKLQEKETECENLKKSLREMEESAEHTDLRSKNDTLQEQIKQLTEQRDEERRKVQLKEKEIANLTIELLHARLLLVERDNFYKDEVRKVESQRDAIKVNLAEEKRKQEEDKRCKAEEENRRLLEQLKLRN
jgi:hypothetical protein